MTHLELVNEHAEKRHELGHFLWLALINHADDEIRNETTHAGGQSRKDARERAPSLS